MNISIVLFCIICFLYLFVSITIEDVDKRNKKFLKLCFVLFFIVLFLRKPYSDLNTYIVYFRYISNLNISQFFGLKYEFLYKFLNLLIGKITANEKVFITIVDLITLVGPYFFIKRYSKNYFFSVLLFLAIGTYYMQFFIIRQALAISFLLLSIKYLSEKNFPKFAGMVIIATLFHTASLLFIVVYFVVLFNNKDFNRKLVLWILLFMLLYIFRNQISSLSLLGRYSYYLGSKYSFSGEGYGKLLLYILLMFFVLAFYKKSVIEDIDSNIMFTIMLICIAIQIMSTNIAVISRLANYFCMGYTILPANGLQNIKRADSKAFFMFLTLIIIFGYLILYNPIDGYEILLGS